MPKQISVRSWKYCRNRTEVESGSHRLLNLIFVVGKIFLKLIGNDITKDLENVLGIFLWFGVFWLVGLGGFVCILRRKRVSGKEKKELGYPGFRKGNG